MAAPHVAAEAALIVARDPTLNAVAAQAGDHRLRRAQGCAHPVRQGGGRANARAALDLVFPPADTDADGVTDGLDNCPAVANPGQADGDGDGTGDACDARPGHDDRDPDADGHANADDNCPAVSNPSQADADADGKGDACDPTPRGVDNDWTAAGALDDNCPSMSNPGQADADGDGQGDVCDAGDPDTRTLDSDGDGVPDGADACPRVLGTVAARGCPEISFDSDGDGRPDAGDRCPAVPAQTPDGCPAPAVKLAPTLSAAKVKAGSGRCGARACKRTLTVTAATSNATGATVRIACEQRRCALKRPLTRTLTVAGGALKLRTRSSCPPGAIA